MYTILSADVGGTKTLLQLSQLCNGKLDIIKSEKIPSGNFSTFTQLLQHFLNDFEVVDSACFAVAGPVKHYERYSESKITNLPWLINSAEIESQLQIKKVALINDFEAIGYAIEHLPEEDFLTIQQGTPQKNGIKAVIGAGTGLGQAILVHTGEHYKVLSTEGGHTDFAANSEIEFALFQYLKRDYSHVSYERVLSGQGIVNVFDFLLEKNNAQNDEAHREILQSNDRAAAISIAAGEKSNTLACETMSLFMKIYGAQAGNLALSCLANGGVYIAGGMAAKNLFAFDDKLFINTFNDKGRMQTLTQKMPVKIITNQNVGLIGATHFACR